MRGDSFLANRVIGGTNSEGIMATVVLSKNWQRKPKAKHFTIAKARKADRAARKWAEKGKSK